MLLSALQEPDPVLIFENVMLYNQTGPLTRQSAGTDLDNAVVRKEGTDISLITYGGSLHKVLAAADELGNQGIDAEVIDLRTLRPLDMNTIAASVKKTHRVLLVDEGWRSGSLAAEIGMRLAEDWFYELDAPLARVCSAEVPIPYARHLEESAIPQISGIVKAVLQLFREHRVSSHG
jgi:pyruvate dehydrogenase E1 component beta subunit/2-oxoisovalerate dehydrogenase E1 component